MPIFSYQCHACGHHFDELQKLDAPPLLDCPACGKPELGKLLSAPNFHLKGRGWRKSGDEPKAPQARPKYAHTFDSPLPHEDHFSAAHDSGHSHNHGHDHGHSHDHDHDD
ncbi:MAG: zinc ribbon domain-containing protein [Gammaproteobacteria bacterium]|nr:zinc ribbon domain-containing protein [Gammaproteobacteria bacterium]